MKLIPLLAILVTGLAALSCGSPEIPAKPNVVYVLSDTHRWGAMSFTQTPEVKTPNLDTLRRQGVSFNRYYVNLPICTPYRALMMTGRWPWQQGLMANHMSLGERVDLPEGQKTKGTLAWAFRHAGYNTAHIGKWHLGDNDARPFGFDKSMIWVGTNNHRRTRYTVDGAPPVEWVGESNATATTKQALEWIEQVHQEAQPFFVVISLNPPHGPFHDAPEAMKALYPDEAALPYHPLDKLRN
ncbi:MAG: sulfatase-like hydrolase/transferase, partial [bacterium]|nr:sulfatase-like hydrolase/transferase [bacterium]